ILSNEFNLVPYLLMTVSSRMRYFGSCLILLMKFFKNAILALKISVKGLRDRARDIVDCDVIISDAIWDSLTCFGKKCQGCTQKF
ncbi:MAG: hypothetical protein ACP5UP_08475, partial [Athalassotoga sp.]|uniref:hypothetical protein n=1 Tax=Athalassotoga sp. TaxID=2022597 RepID=UPI003D07C23D